MKDSAYKQVSQVSVYRMLTVIGSLVSEGEDPPYSVDRLIAKSEELGLRLTKDRLLFKRLLDRLIKEKLIQVRKKGKEFLIYPMDKVFELLPEEEVLRGHGVPWYESSLGEGNPLHKALQFLSSRDKAVSEDELVRHVRARQTGWVYTYLDKLEQMEFISSPKPGYYEITEDGKKYLRWIW